MSSSFHLLPKHVDKILNPLSLSFPPLPSSSSCLLHANTTHTCIHVLTFATYTCVQVSPFPSPTSSQEAELVHSVRAESERGVEQDRHPAVKRDRPNKRKGKRPHKRCGLSHYMVCVNLFPPHDEMKTNCALCVVYCVLCTVYCVLFCLW